MKNNYIIGSKNEAFGPGSIQNAINDTLVKTKGAVDAKLIEKNINNNGTYSASAEGADGFKKVTVDVPNTYFLSDEGKVVSNGSLVSQTSSTVTENGVVDTTLIDSVTVDVPGVQFAASPSAFTLLTNIRNLNVEIPSGITSIGNGAFNGCTGLTSIEIPSSVTSIASYAFQGCTGLTSIEIPSSVTSIASSAFKGCTGLTSIKIPSSVTSIGIDVFAGCTGLTSIEIPSGITSIGSGAFAGCAGLTSIEIPSSVMSIGNGTFANCTNLTSIVVHKAEGSITGAPWGATNATVIWDG